MNIKIDQRMWDAYKDVCFFVNQKLDFFLDKELQASEFCIITACNPHSVLLSDTENRAANRALEQDLLTTKYATILVGDCEKSWTEASYAAEISRVDSTKLAKKYRQNAIYYVQNDQLYLIPCVDCGRSEVQIGRFSQRTVFSKNTIGTPRGKVEGK